MANQWLKIADLDGNGTIDFNEFKEFMTKLQDEETDEDQLREVFNSIDEDGSGELDIDEFAKAIKSSVIDVEDHED